MGKKTPEESLVELLNGQRQKNETDDAVIACNDYLRMGVGRSLYKLCFRYQSATNPLPPTKRLMTLKDWSRNFEWQARASEYDATWENRKTAEREAIFNHGLALDYERVTRLMRLADFLEGQLYEQSSEGVYHNVWMPDVKSVGSGEFAERVDIERFNPGILEQFRKTLDDIAQETGGRVKRTDLTTGGKTFPIIQFQWSDDSDNSGHDNDD